MGGNPGSRPRVRHLHAPFAMSHARFSVLISEKDTPHANRTFVRVARDLAETYRKRENFAQIRKGNESRFSI